MKAPIATKRPHLLEAHGRTRCDDYYWLRDRDDPETLAYLKAENEYLEAAMEHTGALRETLVAEMKGRIPESDVSAPLRRADFIYYTRVEPGKEYPLYCRKRGTDGAEELLLDQNALAEGHPYCGLGAFEVSPDHTRLAYLLDTAGGETYTLYVKDLASGTLLPDVIENLWGLLRARAGLSWALDNQTIYYSTVDEAHRPYRLFRHRLGSDPAADELVYEESDVTYGMYITPTRSADTLLVRMHSTSSDEVRILPLDTDGGALQVVSPRQPFIEYEVDRQGDRLLIVTNEGAPNFRLMAAPLADLRRENWVELVGNREDVTLEQALAFSDDLVLVERQDGLLRARISGPDAHSNVRYIDMPEPAYTIQPEQNLEYQTRAFRFVYTSLVTPRSVVEYDMAAGQWNLLKQEVIPSGYDAGQYATERVYAQAPDGQRVPVSLVYRKGAARPGPLVLNGYGSYGYSMDPTFIANRLSLLDRGFTFAIAHIRGGADMGRSWYEDGKMLKKKNTFTDFIACAEYLVAQGYTTRRQLGILGGSAGGLLVGAVMTMRPDLCQAVVAQVPFVDVVTTMSDPTIPLTTFEYDQWGNPDDPLYFNYMLSYSPYDQIRPTDYPDILITTGLNDPRVAFWEPAKFAARLRDLKTSDSLVLLYTDFGSGHGGASGRYKALDDVARVYAFLIDRLS